MNKTSYRGVLCLHPNLEKQWIDFNQNPFFTVLHGIPHYSSLLTESSLMITDYSSIAFDFAFLRKPIIYCPFDHDAFYASHTYKEGYFNYYTHGFGPVCVDLDCLINRTIDMIINNCQLPHNYLERIESFYAYFDGNSSWRVFHAIRARDKYIPPHETWVLWSDMHRFWFIILYLFLLLTIIYRVVLYFYRLLRTYLPIPYEAKTIKWE